MSVLKLKTWLDDYEASTRNVLTFTPCHWRQYNMQQIHHNHVKLQVVREYQFHAQRHIHQKLQMHFQNKTN